MPKPQEIAKQVSKTIEPMHVQKMIHIIRGERVILDSDLAMLYGVETKNIKRQVKRNLSRFPEDFMMELTREEYNSLRCQNGTIEKGRGEHSKYLPFAFTENGVAMLSSVLTSEIAVQVNIQIMRAFTLIRKSLVTLTQTEKRQEQLELKIERLSNYVEDILRDQNDINEEVSAQMDAISRSMSELAVKVDDITGRKKKLLHRIGYQAIWEQEQKNE